jgi:putative transposase
MAKKRCSAEQIIEKLREPKVLQVKGKSHGEIVRFIGAIKQTMIGWRKEYGGLRFEQSKRFKEFEKKNIRLKLLIADLSLDKAIFKDAA